MAVDKSEIKKKWYSRLLFAVVLTAVSLFIWRNIGQLLSVRFRFTWHYLLLSFLFVLFGHTSNLLIWKGLACSFGVDAGLFHTGKAWFLSRLGRYVPGKVTLLLVRFDQYPGISKRSVALATGTEYISSLASACIMVLVALTFAPYEGLGFIRIIAGAMAFVMFIILYPPFLKKIANWFFRIIRRDPLINEFPSYGVILKYVGAYLFPALMHGLGFFFLISAFYPLSFEHYLTLTGTYYAAALVGLAAVFAPSGIGVREGVMFLILPAIMPKSVVIIGTIAIRLVNTLGELFLTGIFCLLKRAD